MALHRPAVTIGPSGAAVGLRLRPRESASPAVACRVLAVSSRVLARQGYLGTGRGCCEVHPRGLTPQCEEVAHIRLLIAPRGGIITLVRDEVPLVCGDVTYVPGVVTGLCGCVPIVADLVALSPCLIAKDCSLIAKVSRIIAITACSMTLGCGLHRRWLGC